MIYAVLFCTKENYWNYDYSTIKDVEEFKSYKAAKRCFVKNVREYRKIEDKSKEREHKTLLISIEQMNEDSFLGRLEKIELYVDDEYLGEKMQAIIR